MPGGCRQTQERSGCTLDNEFLSPAFGLQERSPPGRARNGLERSGRSVHDPTCTLPRDLHGQDDDFHQAAVIMQNPSPWISFFPFLASQILVGATT